MRKHQLLIRVFYVALMALVLAACQSLADVKPGDGKKITINERSYEDIWNAARPIRKIGRQIPPGFSMTLESILSSEAGTFRCYETKRERFTW